MVNAHVQHVYRGGTVRARFGLIANRLDRPGAELLFRERHLLPGNAYAASALAALPVPRPEAFAHAVIEHACALHELLLGNHAITPIESSHCLTRPQNQFMQRTGVLYDS